MWRTLLTGKLTISILASCFIGYLCLNHPAKHQIVAPASTRWYALGLFFFALAVAQVTAIVLLSKRR
ncbi:hypothetical protein N9B12_01005 [bacterium]|nr:hypothetical protein [bacterium]MDA7887616.1 hypothetical protein [bacterium]MDA7905567.1 hypothetical protein [Mariniblastus sp.]